MRGHRQLCVSIVLSLGIGLGLIGRSAEPSSGQTPQPPPNLPAQLKLKDSTKDVFLVGRKGSKVLYCFSDASRSVLALEANDIQRTRIRLEYDTAALDKAVGTQDWGAASSMLTRIVWPALPFLDLKGNNATPMALRAGLYLMRAAMTKTSGAFTPEQARAADIDYRTACTILATVGKAGWYDRADEATLRAVICLVLLDRPEDAKKELDRIAEPGTTDETYGLYWLSRAHLSAAGEESLAAMDQVSLAVDFDTHDIDTFPDALLLSAKCYEKLEDWYRARDVYYELGMLFSKTYWGEIATNRLKHVMAQELTETPEEARIRNVFFGVEEDMNVKVKEFLSGGADKKGDEKGRKPAEKDTGADKGKPTGQAPAKDDNAQGNVAPEKK